MADSNSDRQTIIPRWDQTRLDQTTVAVSGADWLGCYLALGLQALHVRLAWTGRAGRRTRRLAAWIEACKFAEEPERLTRLRAPVQFGSELDAVASGATLLMVATRHAAERANCLRWARERSVPALALGEPMAAAQPATGAAAHKGPAVDDPIVSLVVAGLMIDAALNQITPLHDDHDQMAGTLSLPTIPLPRLPASVVDQVGVGGIGAFSALSLAADGISTHLVDHDRADVTNLNRQVLFTSRQTADEQYKALSARHTLSRIFPDLQFTAEVRRIDTHWVERRNELGVTRPLISAVDNARARVAMQRSLSDVIQGGTDLFAADCHVQRSGGITLDEQLHGMLVAAAEREQRRAREGHCDANPSYVVPSMIAGGLVALRTRQLLAGVEGELPPIHWRAGSMPVVARLSKTTRDLTL